MRVFTAIFLLFILSTVAEVPKVIIYQGRLRDHASLETPRGDLGQRLDFRVIIRKVSEQSLSVPPLLNQILSDIPIYDGLFTLPIDISQGAQGTLTFDEPYFLELLIGDAKNGGKIGQHNFHAVPYAFGSQNTLQLNSKSTQGYAKVDHNLTRLDAPSFLIDRSSERENNNRDQLTIKNDSSGQEREVFVVNENADLSSVHNISLTTLVVNSLGGLTASTPIGIKRLNSKGNTVLVVRITPSGDLIATDSEFPGTLSVGGTLAISGSLGIPGALTEAQKANHSVEIEGDAVLKGLLEFTPGSSVEVLGTTNPLGLSHQIENHLQNESAPMLGRLTNLLINQILDDSFHTHQLTNREINNFNADAVDGSHIRDGSLVNADFQDVAEENLIDDSKLAQIATTGKISLSALPADVVRKDLDNDYTFIFPQTLNLFDGIISKTFTISSTRSDSNANIFPLLSLKPNANEFEYKILSNGDMSYVFSQGTILESTFGLINPAGKVGNLKFQAKNIRFVDAVNAGDASFFSGKSIENLSLTSADLGAGAIDQNKLKDGGVGTGDFADLSVDTAELGEIDENAFESASVTESKISSVIAANFIAGAVETVDLATGAITAAELADNAVISTSLDDFSVTSNDIDDSDIITAKFADSAVQEASLPDLGVTSNDLLSGAVDSINLENDSINPDKIEDLAVTTQKFADSAIQTINLTTLSSDLIQIVKISSEVLINRALPMAISTDESPILSLVDDDGVRAGTGLNFIKMKLDGFTSEANYKAGLEILDKNGLRIISLNNNGSLSMRGKSGSSLIPVTLEAPMMATLFRREDSAGNCGLGDSKMQLLVGSGTDLRSDCISKVQNHNIAPLNFFGAMQACEGQGYQVCDVNQVMMACSQEKLDTDEALLLRNSLAISSGLTQTAITFRVLNGVCSSETDFAFESVHATDDSTGFRCCLK